MDCEDLTFGSPVFLFEPRAKMAENTDITTPGAAAMNAAFQDPQMLAALQQRLGQMQGQASGYIASLPLEVRLRMNALKNLQKENDKIEGQFQKELLELEKKYLLIHAPVYKKRQDIVTGKYEPTEEETARDQDSDEDELPEASDEPKVAGIPEFWLTALKNLPPVAEAITEEDEGALKHLVDIRYKYMDDNAVHYQPNFRASPLNSSLKKTSTSQTKCLLNPTFWKKTPKAKDLSTITPKGTFLYSC